MDRDDTGGNTSTSNGTTGATVYTVPGGRGGDGSSDGPSQLADDHGGGGAGAGVEGGGGGGYAGGNGGVFGGYQTGGRGGTSYFSGTTGPLVDVTGENQGNGQVDISFVAPPAPVADPAVTTVTSTLNGASFTDGTQADGSFTALYDANGKLLSVTDVDVTVSGTYPGDSTHYTETFDAAFVVSSNGTYSIELSTDGNNGGNFDYGSEHTNQYGGTYASGTPSVLSWTSETPTSLNSGSAIYDGPNQTNAQTLAMGGVITNVATLTASTLPIQEISADGAGADSSIIYDVPAIYGQPGYASQFQVDAFGSGDSVTLSAADFGPTAATDTFSYGLQGDNHDLYVTDENTGDSVAFTLIHTYSDATNIGDTLGDAPGDVSETDVNGNIIFTAVPLCYLHGTLILTPAGAVPVENLQIGDAVVTRFGAIQRIKWLGRQSYAPRFIANNPEKWPVRIAAGALAEAVPLRDVFVWPGHAMLLGDTLVLASNLVNGVTITQTLPQAQVNYTQIELAAHDCVLAEGAWSETYADAPGQRAQFHNAAEFSILYPEEPPIEIALPLCASRPDNGPAMAAALLPVVQRASIQPGKLQGWVESAGDWKITGWAHDSAHPQLPVLLEFLTAGQVIGTTLARNFRKDLQKAGKGAGNCAFSFTPPMRLRPEDLATLTIRRATDYAPLAGTKQFHRQAA